MTESDPTTQRRDYLLALLSRFERGVITDQERPLLRPLVEAEMATYDQLEAFESGAGVRPPADTEPLEGALARLRANLAAFRDVLEESDREPWAKTVGGSLDALGAEIAAIATPAAASVQDGEAGL